MLKILSNILCDLDPKVKVIGQKAGICDGVPLTSALVNIIAFIIPSHFIIVPYFTLWIIDFFNTIRVSNNLDPDQARHFVGPDLGPNCLQILSADNKR